MQVKNVDFLLTFKCPSKCKHCSYVAGPRRTGSMKLPEAEGHLKGLVDTQPLRSFGVHGGEPFLYFDLLKHIIQKAKELDITHTWVITNGFWAKNEEKANQMLFELRKAGLANMTFSVDGFHQEFIPFKYVKTGIETAARLGFNRVSVDSYFVVGEDADNFYDRSTRKSVKSLEELDNIEIHKRQADLEGRGASELRKYAKPSKGMPSGKCHIPFWIGGDLKSPQGIEIDFRGNVTLCPGICIGNTRRKPLTKILLDYDINEQPILSLINKEGPIGLLKVATAKGLVRQQGYVNECHLCYEMRKFLRPHFPDCLAPQTCYDS